MMVEPTNVPDPEGLGPSERFRKLPERTALGDMIATQETSPPPDPTMGRNVEQDTVLRYVGG